MEELILNNSLKMTVPDGFHVMSEEERSKLRFATAEAGECLSDPDRHIIVSLGWKQIGLLPRLMLSSKDIAKRLEKLVSESNNEYRLEGFPERQIAGTPSDGVSYAYKASEINMIGQSYVSKIGSAIYYFHLYGREELKEETLRVWGELLDSVQTVM